MSPPGTAPVKAILPHQPEPGVTETRKINIQGLCWLLLVFVIFYQQCEELKKKRD